MPTKKHPTKKAQTKSDQIYILAEKRRAEHRAWVAQMKERARKMKPKGFTYRYMGTPYGDPDTWCAFYAKQQGNDVIIRRVVIGNTKPQISVAEGKRFLKAGV